MHHHQIDKHIKYATIKSSHHHHHHIVQPQHLQTVQIIPNKNHTNNGTVRLTYPIVQVNATVPQVSTQKIIRKKIIIHHARPPVPAISNHQNNNNSVNTSNSSSSSDSSLSSDDHHHYQQIVPFAHQTKREREHLKQANKRFKHNREVFHYLTPGDVLEYSKYDEVWNENDRLWAIYAGNGYVIRFDKHSAQIVSEPYWNLASSFYMSHNLDLDRNYFCLSPQTILQRAHYALQCNYAMRYNFSSDKNFVTWCRYDINKSDIEFSTNLNKCPTEASKYLMITRFLDSIEKYGHVTEKEKAEEKEK